MQCYAELIPPTAVTHSVGLALTSPSAHNLAVVKGSLLQIFETKTVSSDVDDDEEDDGADGDGAGGNDDDDGSDEDSASRRRRRRRRNTNSGAHPSSDHAMPDEDGGVEGSFLGPETALLRPGRARLTKLVLVAEVPLAGVVAALGRVAMPQSSTRGPTADALLIAYRSARMVVTVWDAERAALAEVSLHSFEKDEAAGGAPWEAPLADTRTAVEVDPANRCVALRFGAHSLGILPFKTRADEGSGGGDDDDWDEDLDGPRPEGRKKGGRRGGAADADGDATMDGEDGVPHQQHNDSRPLTNGGPPHALEAPYASSFILRLPQMDGSLTHPIDLGFLHQYREPTFGILSGGGRQRGRGLGRRDEVAYKVFTLDLQQRASTAILSVEGLPGSLFQMVALPAPAGGALLVGHNELMHVDQSGRTNGVAVNGFARLGAVSATATAAEGGAGAGAAGVGGGGGGGGGAGADTPNAAAKISLADQSGLDLRLEGCHLEMVWPEAGELLMVLADGRLAIVSLRIEGRTVSGLSVRLVAADAGGTLLPTGAACLARVGRPAHPCVFVGSTGSDSTLLGWTRQRRRGRRRNGGQQGARRMQAANGAYEYDLDDVDLGSDEEEEEEEEEEDDDDDEEEGDAAMADGAGPADEDVVDIDVDDDDDDLYGESASEVKSLSKQAQRRGKSSGGNASSTRGAPPKPAEVSFRVHDSMFSLAPIRELTPGRQVFAPDSQEQRNHAGAVADLHLALAVGRGAAGALAIVNRELQPHVVGRFEFPEARGLWTMCVRKPTPKVGGGGGVTATTTTTTNNLSRDEAAAPSTLPGQPLPDLSAHNDTLMIVAKADADGTETSDVYALTAAGFEALAGTEFEPAAGTTILAGPMAAHARVVQVLRAEVRSYDGALGLCQIVPMLDDDTGAEPRVLAASMVDACLLLVRDDGSAVVVGIDTVGELGELEPVGGGGKSRGGWVAGCLYRDGRGVFGAAGGVLVFVVDAEGGLSVFALPDLATPVFTTGSLAAVPPRLCASTATVVTTTTATTTTTTTTTTTPAPAAATTPPAENIPVEIVVADLGDRTDATPFFVIRHRNHDLSIYQPVRTEAPSAPLAASLWFKKMPNPMLARPTGAQKEETPHSPPPPMRACADVGGYAAIFVPGAAPAFILKSAKSIPRVVGLHSAAAGGVRAMSPFNTDGCARGFVYADAAGVARVARLPRRTDLAALGVPARKIELGFDVTAVAHHPPTDTYVVAGSTFEAADPAENPHGEAAAKDGGTASSLAPSSAAAAAAAPPLCPRGVVKLVTPLGWATIHSLVLDPFERVECMRTLSLEVSEDTRERRLLVAVGLSISRGEDLAVRGAILVLDVVPVIPFPDRPNSDRRLRRVAREDIPRGAVTALAEIGAQGLMLVAQGQKCMVRGLKEDGSLLPVAFLDMSCHVSALSELRGSGLCVMADAVRGVWFAGYTEEPYRMMILGKSASRVQVVAAEFLPHARELAVIAVDVDGDLHVLEFNPEDPKSIQGHHLLHRTTFAMAPNAPSRTLLLPSSSPPVFTAQNTPQILLLASHTGQLAAVTPLADAAHRCLSALQAQLSAALPVAAGMSVKAQRAPLGTTITPAAGGGGAAGGVRVGISSLSSAGGRSIVDATVLARWDELAAVKRAEIAARAGFEGASVAAARGEMGAVLGWAGLQYF